MGQASRRRIQAGGKLAVGRQSASAVAWGEIIRQIGVRSRGQCEVTLGGLRCQRPARDACHVKKRSAGGSDSLENLYHGCRYHHEQEDAPFSKGRLLVESMGGELFFFRLVTAPDKFAFRA